MKKAKVIINRWTRSHSNENVTIGRCYITDGTDCVLFESYSLERGWRDNKRNVSCVPNGAYPLVFEWSPRFKRNLWELKDVPGRSECKFHPANKWQELNGCIALGKWDGNEGLKGGTSGPAINKFHKVLEQFDSVTLFINAI